MMKTMRTSLATVLILALICAMAPMASATDSDISVTVDGEAVVWTDAAPFIDANNRTLVPLRAVADALGLEVAWDGTARQATFTETYAADAEDTVYLEDKSAYVSKAELVFTIDSAEAMGYVYQTAVADGAESVVTVPVAMDTAAIIKDSRTYAPIRYLAEAFDCAVNWNGETQTVLITTEVPAVVQEVAASVAAMAALVAVDLEGEWGDKHVALMASGEGGEYKDYAAMKAVLDEFRVELGAYYVYCLFPDANNDYCITVDGSEEPDDFGENYGWEVQFDEAWAGEPASARSAWIDSDDTDLVWSGFAPVLDSEGNVVAIVGVDFPAPEILDYPQWVRDYEEWNHIED